MVVPAIYLLSISWATLVSSKPSAVFRPWWSLCIQPTTLARPLTPLLSPPSLLSYLPHPSSSLLVPAPYPPALLHPTQPPHRPLANFSCHFPLFATAGTSPASATSSTVSCTVEKARRPTFVDEPPCCCIPGGAGMDTGSRRINALDVFFCRREYVLPPVVEPGAGGVLRRAAVGEGVRVRLGGGGGFSWEGGRGVGDGDWVGAAGLGMGDRGKGAYVGGFADSRRATSSSGSSMSL